jgi:NADH-quinone oxidoreductase subunit N
MVNELLNTLPLTFATVWALILIVVQAAKDDAKLTRMLTAVGLVLMLASVFVVPPEDKFAFSDMIRVGVYASFTDAVFIISALLVVVISDKYLQDEEVNFGEYYILIFLSLIGMMLMGSAANLIITFIGLETMSISLYVLAGLMRKDKTSNEAAMKYFLLGSFATGFFLYGIAMIYGATGQMNLIAIGKFIHANGTSPLFWVGIGLLSVGFFFKVSAVPFHQWTPDVYEGSPTTATAFMSTGAKAAAFSSLALVASNISSGLVPTGGIQNWQLVTAYIAIATMIVGNVTALAQDNLKRMLAYSSIAHAGYMLVGIAAGTVDGYSGVLYYTLIYTLMNIGAFGVIALIERHRSAVSITDYAGLFKSNPLAATLMAVFMFSLAGMPPLGGFIGKYKVFMAAVEAKMVWLAVIGVLASVVSVYYYLRVIVFMFMRDGDDAKAVTVKSGFVLVAVAVIILLMGIFPTEILKLTDSAMRSVAVR